MGLQMSSINSLIVGETLNKQFDIYKIRKLDGIEYYKVEDLLDLNLKKAIEPILVTEKQAQDVFKLINKLDHKNIIKVDYFVDNGLFYAVRKYDDDYYAFAWRLQIQRHLQEYRKNIEIEEEQIIYWIMQLLKAVACLHDNNILHKFVIPEAISFKRTCLKLFVPARSTILQTSEHYVEEEKTWYNCPEHIALGMIGLKYDIWSAGWTLYSFCALEDCRFLLQDIKDFKEWERPDIPRFYSRDIDRLFKLMTLLDPNERPTAQELLEDPIFDDFIDK